MRPTTGLMGLLLTCLALTLAACGERDQSLANKSAQKTEKPWSGARSTYAAKGWTAGNEDSWRAQIRSRGQQQNEYVKTN